MKEGRVQMIVFSNIENRNLVDALRKMRVANVLPWKLNGQGLYQCAQERLASLDILTSGSQRSTERGSEKNSTHEPQNNYAKKQEAFQTTMVDPLTIESDCWILDVIQGAKFIMGRWMLEVVGPGPSAGSWKPCHDTGTDAKAWEWVTRKADDFRFVTNEGKWIYTGRQPEFNWQTNIWRFVGDAPELCFCTATQDTQGHTTRQVVGYRFRLREGNNLEIAQNSVQAMHKYAFMEATFKSSMNLKQRKTQAPEETKPTQPPSPAPLETNAKEAEEAEAHPKHKPRTHGRYRQGADSFITMRFEITLLDASGTLLAARDEAEILEFGEGEIRIGLPNKPIHPGDGVRAHLLYANESGIFSECDISGLIEDNSTDGDRQVIGLRVRNQDKGIISGLQSAVESCQATAHRFMKEANGDETEVDPLGLDQLLLSQFLADNDCVIADPAQSSRIRLADLLVDLGANRDRIALAATFQEARSAIIERKPGIVLCDYFMGFGSGLTIIEELKIERADGRRGLFVVTSANTSQAAVARSVEKEIDSFLIKPFTKEMVCDALAMAVTATLAPSDFKKSIAAGREKLQTGNRSGAIELFQKAMTQDPSPALACFYCGQVHMMEQAWEQAAASFEEGLSYNRTHFKCLSGLYEARLKLNLPANTYAALCELFQYFQANQKRLTAILSLAVKTENYKHLGEYYQVFTRLVAPSEALVRHMCASLLVGGRYYLTISARSRAVDYLEKAIFTAGGRMRYVQYAIECLVANDLKAEAKQIVERLRKHKTELKKAA